MSKYLFIVAYMVILLTLTSCGSIRDSRDNQIQVKTEGTTNINQQKDSNVQSDKDINSSSDHVTSTPIISEQPDNLNSPSVQPAKIPELTIDDAKTLLNEAYKRTQVATVYGNEQKSFDVADEKSGYYFYSDDLNSKEKLNDYLDKVFTDNVSKSIINSLSLKVIHDRLAFQTSEWSSYSSYLKVDIKVKEETNDSKILEFDYSEFKNPDKIISTSLVKYLYIDGQGWRITSDDPQHIIEIF
ncbi:MAG: hypothetical protein A2189_00915 [Paenibacillus sp. RIFOXYA1_FULL_44_5]|nr:MAG: hypothetical protein A2189_00915 [Paenibacillus sp. RIFOXYA1_FULL_44_5]